MFVDHQAWPPRQDGTEPDRRPARMSALEERTLLALIGILLVTIFVAPFAGASVITAIGALLGKL